MCVESFESRPGTALRRSNLFNSGGPPDFSPSCSAPLLSLEREESKTFDHDTNTDGDYARVAADIHGLLAQEPTRLFALNRQVDELNAVRLAQLPAEAPTAVFVAEDRGNSANSRSKLIYKYIYISAFNASWCCSHFLSSQGRNRSCRNSRKVALHSLTWFSKWERRRVLVVPYR